jgi:hypothetical protein
VLGFFDFFFSWSSSETFAPPKVSKHQLKIEASQNKEAKVSDKQVTINGTKNPKKKK